MAISSNATGLRPGVVTSTTRPTAPYTGQLIFETDTFKLQFWNGSAWQGAVSAPAGTVEAYAGSTAPTGWLLCAGQAVSRTTYADLFSAISTTYGSGDGSTTFNLPDLRGRTIAGVDNMGGSAANRITSGGSGITGTTLGAVGGAETHTLTTAQMPSHTHIQDSHNHSQNSHNHTQDAHNHSQNAHSHTTKINTSNINTRTAGTAGYNVDTGGADPTSSVTATNIATTATNQATTATNIATTATNQNTGGGGAHQNTQPTMVLNYIIKF